ncbi:MAG TPA: pentapeptide repeat-containing protein [Bacteroidia bacterium]|nr:pentapeptide repeat-containing protein [Bacteroidia bacterium]
MEAIVIGDKIARARKKTNLSQAQLAEKLFISPQAVGKWERGESVPDIVTIGKLAKILGVDLNYFSDSSQSIEAETGHAGADDTTQTVNGSDSPSAERRLLTNFNGSALAETDFTGVSAQKRKFIGSDLHGSDFSGADLTGSSFTGSDLHDADFGRTNLTDCSFVALDLTNAGFNETILVRTEFSSSDLSGATFRNTKLVDVKLTTTDLKKTIFENCTFSGVDFKSSDLSGLCLDGQTFTGVRFDNADLKNASFKGATLKNVSFRPSFALTNRYYKTLKTISFDGAKMDKLTYAALKGVGVDLSKVTTI